jgi:uncharacterized protein (DUF4213/DUF364 family)
VVKEIQETLSLLKDRYQQENRPPGVLTKIGIKPQWSVLIGTNGQSGMATNFTGKHELYGKHATPAETLQSYIGKDFFSVAEETLDSQDLLLRSLGHGALSALSQPVLDPGVLEKQKLRMHFWADFRKGGPVADRVPHRSMADLVTAEDVVAVVGYGGMIRRLLGKCKELHVTEMREKEVFQTIVIAERISVGPEQVTIHRETENKEVLGRADVVIITASSLLNGTFEELMGYARNARLIGLYGPSASVLPDAFFRAGIGAVFTFRMIDAAAFEYAMLNDIDMEVAIKERQMPSLIQRFSDTDHA